MDPPRNARKTSIPTWIPAGFHRRLAMQPGADLQARSLTLDNFPTRFPRTSRGFSEETRLNRVFCTRNHGEQAKLLASTLRNHRSASA